MVRRIVYNPHALEIALQNHRRSAETQPRPNAYFSGKDTCVISNEAQKLGEQLQLFNTIKIVNGKSIQELRAHNNVLTLEAGEYYRFKMRESQDIIVQGLGGWAIEVPYDDIGADFGSDYTFFTPELWPVFDRMQQFLTYLNDPAGWYMHQNFTHEEVLDYCSKLDIKPGWVEINNAGHKNNIYLREDGVLWPKSDIDGSRLTLATRDFREDGCTADSVMIVNGKEYKMDENGHFNIPEGEPIIYGYNVEFPKELSAVFFRGWPAAEDVQSDSTKETAEIEQE